jgi:hypothetical protein
MRVFRVLTSHCLPAFNMLVLLSLIMGSISPAKAERRAVYDFTGDGRTDFVTLSTASVGTPQTWKVLRNPGTPALMNIFDYGLVGDSITPGDRFGDSKFEVGYWRAGFFYSNLFPPSGPQTIVFWGLTGDNLGRDGDYDGNGKDDYTIIRVVGGVLEWFYKSAENIPANDRKVVFGNTAAGQALFAFQGADFTGDAREEIIIARVTTATGEVTWQIGDSLNGSVLYTVPWGNHDTDIIIQPDDYTGDGIADLVVWRGGGDGTWWIRDTATGQTVPPVVFGISDPAFIGNDLACRGDYDGDNVADIAVFRPSTREFFWIKSSNPFAIDSQQWGDANDLPLATFFTF